jgi:hypothetical protein
MARIEHSTGVLRIESEDLRGLKDCMASFTMNTRKAYKRPQEENARAFSLNTLKFVPAIFALSRFDFLTITYPLVAAVVLVRHKH